MPVGSLRASYAAPRTRSFTLSGWGVLALRASNEWCLARELSDTTSHQGVSYLRSEYFRWTSPL